MKAVVFASSIMLWSALSVVILPAQTRPRRVEQTRPVGSSPTTSGQSATGVQESSASPKTTPEGISENETVRINTTLVTVPASVMDRNGRYIPDLIKEDFRIFENGVEQEVSYFAAVENPFTVVLMLDTSASTWSKLGQIRDAAIAFVDQLRPDDRVMVVSFARGLTITCEATSDRQKIRKAIRSTGRGLSTHLYDASDATLKWGSIDLESSCGREAVTSTRLPLQHRHRLPLTPQKIGSRNPLGQCCKRNHSSNRLV